MHSLKFTQVCTDICISLTDLPSYKGYILHHKVKYCVFKIPMTVEYGLTTFMVWVIQLYEQVIHLYKNLASIFLNMEGGIRPWRLDFLAQINKHGVRIYQGPKSMLVHLTTLWYTVVHPSTLWYTLIHLSTLWYTLVELYSSALTFGNCQQLVLSVLFEGL